MNIDYELELDNRIWDLAKNRFLQTEARFWFLSSRALEVILLVSVVTSAHFEIFSIGPYPNVKVLGMVLAGFSLITYIGRNNEYSGYFSGYENGFKDAATRNIGYSDTTHNEDDDYRAEDYDYRAIGKTLRRIEKNEKNACYESRTSMDAAIKEGVKRSSSFFPVWRWLR